MTLGDMLRIRAQENPSKTALHTPAGDYSYLQLDSASTLAACWLLERGLTPGDRIAILWHNSFEAMVLYFAAFKAGVIAVPVNLRMKAPEVAYVFQNSGARLCFSAPAFLQLAETAASSCPAVGGIVSQLPTGAQSRPLPQSSPDDTALIMHTSGTTARPKGACCTHRAFLAGCECLAAEIAPGGPAICTTPVMHVAALCVALGALYNRESVVLLPGFNPAEILDSIERYRCSFAMSLPALLQFIVDEQTRSPRNVSSLRVVLAGGDSVSVALQKRFRELFGLQLQEFHGITEGGVLAVNPAGAIREGSMGRPVSMVQVRIVDRSGLDVPDGETGEVLMRSPSVTPGYWNDPATTSELLRDGWLHTGDLASRDSEGYLWFRGRLKQIIVRGGSNISPQEVEEVLYQHPGVREAGVVGQPDPVLGEIPVAFVALRPDSLEDETSLIQFTRSRLADYKTPERIIFLSELPKGLTGKVDRRALKEMLVAQSGVATA